MSGSDQLHVVTRNFLELSTTTDEEPNNRMPDPKEPLFGDAAMNAIPRSHISEDLPPSARWLCAKAQASTSHVSCPGMKRPDWMNAWQQFLSFKSSHNDTNAIYGLGHPKGHENGVVGARMLDCASMANGTTMVKKHFPFQVPSPCCEQAVTMRMQPNFLLTGSPCPAGQANTPASSSSDVPADAYKSTYTRISHSADESLGAQLTIFYRGKVNVYKDVPREKAQNIMLLAASGSPNSPANCGPQLVDKESLFVDDAPTVGGESMHTYFPDTCTLNEPVVLQALPHARKASLARFLERRKERILSKVPYATKKSFL